MLATFIGGPRHGQHEAMDNPPNRMKMPESEFMELVAKIDIPSDMADK